MAYGKIFFVIGLMFSETLAADVYATFSTPQGTINPNFDVGNNGCFAAAGATSVSFSQAGGNASPVGPYCLEAFTDSGCPDVANGQQEFDNVSLGGYEYSLNSGVANAGSYRWLTDECDGS